MPEDARGLRYDRALAGGLARDGRRVSVREVRQALRAGRIRIDGRRRAPGDRARGGEEVDLSSFVARSEARIVPNPELLTRVDVVYEDPRLLVLNKPSGVACQPVAIDDHRTLLSAAVAHAAEIAEAGPPLEGGLAHRLDVGTSGVVVFAKNSAQRRELRDAFSGGRVQKRYVVLASDPKGVFTDGGRVLDGAIAAPRGRHRVSVVPRGTLGAMAARSVVRAVARAGPLVWLVVDAVTGRRHQVRAHLAAAGAPVVHDVVYGSAQPAVLSRLGLHAARLRLGDGTTFEAPVTGELAERVEALFGRRP